MTSRTNHHAEWHDQIGNMPAPLSALRLRRQDAIERSLAGDPIEAMCREMGYAKSWLYTWENRYEARKPTWLQERSRRPRITPTQTPEALERAIVRFRDSVSPGRVATRQCASDAGSSASTPRRVTPLASYDLSHPQVASKEVTSHAGRGKVSRCSWRSRRLEKRLTGVRARTDRKSFETRGPHTSGRRQSHRGPVPQYLEWRKKNIHKGA